MFHINTSTEALTKEEDLFDTCRLAENIRKYVTQHISRKAFETEQMIALYGEWGSGKTRVLRTTERLLKRENIDADIIWYDVWKYETDRNLPLSLVKYIRTKIGLSGITRIIAMAYSSFERNTKAIVEATEISYGAFGANVNISGKRLLERIEKRNERCIWEIQDEMQKQFQMQIDDKQPGGRKIIVFLDDMDRCESENVLSLLTAIKNLMTISRNVLFIIGLDKDAVELALMNRYGNDKNKAANYLNKIFPISFYMPQTFTVEAIVAACFTVESRFITRMLYSLGYTTPRHVIRLINSYFQWEDSIGDNKKYFLNKDERAVGMLLLTGFVLFLMILRDTSPLEYSEFLEMENKYIEYQNAFIMSKIGGSTQKARVFGDITPNVDYSNLKIKDIFFGKTAINGRDYRGLLLGPRLTHKNEHSFAGINKSEDMFQDEKGLKTYRFFSYISGYTEEELKKYMTDEAANFRLKDIISLIESSTPQRLVYLGDEDTPSINIELDSMTATQTKETN